MKEIEVRIANKTVVLYGFLGAILLGGMLYYFGTKIQYTSQQTYFIVIGLSLYTYIMYVINVKKSKLVRICIFNDSTVKIKEPDGSVLEINISKYYYKNIIPNKMGFILQLTADVETTYLYIVSKNLANYRKSDAENVFNLSKELDHFLKGKKSRDLLLDFISFLPVILLMICLVIIVGFIYYAIYN